MINNDQSTLLLYCCEDVKSHRSGGDTVPLRSRVVAKTSAREGSVAVDLLVVILLLANQRLRNFCLKYYYFLHFITFVCKAL